MSVLLDWQTVVHSLNKLTKCSSSCFKTTFSSIIGTTVKLENGLYFFTTYETRYATYDENMCMLTNIDSYIIEYQLIQTTALVNCNHVYF